MKNGILSLVMFLAVLLQARAQQSAPLPDYLLNKPWSAQWITVPNTPAKEYGVYHFRKIIDLSGKPEKFIIHVSGDNRYKLFVNGSLVSLGPARSDFYRWNFETVDIAPFLQSGKNALAAVVWNYGAFMPVAQTSFQTGFILQGNGPAERVADTGKSWKSWQNKAYSPLATNLYTYFVVGPGDKIDYTKYPWGWEQQDYDDSQWATASAITPGLAEGLFVPWYGGWMLTPRTIPQMELSPQRLQRVRRTDNLTVPASFPQKKTTLTIPARTKATFILDQNHLTTAYPVVMVSGGKGASVTLSYAESLYLPEEGKQISEIKNKGNRDRVEGKIFIGYKDAFTTDGGNNRTFNSLWWRTYRYMEVMVETQNEPLQLEDLYGLYTAYPFEVKARFEAGAPQLNKILEVGWRTAQLCAHETYMDTPYYEQLQYVGDTRIQALISLYNSGDDRLMRNAITQIRNSSSLDGITMSRYPTNLPQHIPPFSLLWIGMVNDYWKYRGDSSFVKSMLPVTRTVLHFFNEKRNKDGLLGRVPYWNFTDWADDKAWKAGVPPMANGVNSSPLNLQLLLAYQAAEPLERTLGMNEYAGQYNQHINKLKQEIKNVYWDETKGLFADTPEKNMFSQHANALAVLTGVVEGEQAKQLMEKVLTDKSLIQCTIYFKYYLHQAVAKAGLGDRYVDLLDEWRNQLSRGLTTWAEQPEPTRSDCHAWGSSPNIELYRILLGIDSDAPAFSKVLIAPHLGNLKQASGSIPHPNGEIAVNYKVDKKGKLTAEISLPEGVTGTFAWKGEKTDLKSGKQVLKK